MKNLYEDDYPEGIANESFWHNKPAPITWRDTLIIASIWLGVVAVAFGIVFGAEYLLVEAFL
jgi:hypothetical protein